MSPADLTLSAPSANPDLTALWICAVCGRPRHNPYAAPTASDPTEACRSCGDLLARAAEPRATAEALPWLV